MNKTHACKKNKAPEKKNRDRRKTKERGIYMYAVQKTKKERNLHSPALIFVRCASKTRSRDPPPPSIQPTVHSPPRTRRDETVLQRTGNPILHRKPFPSIHNLHILTLPLHPRHPPTKHHPRLDL